MNQRGIGFLASITSDTYYVEKGKTVHFDRLVTNEGNSFDQHNAIFTAPVNGLYVCSVTISAFRGKNGVEVVKDGINLRRIFSHSNSGEWNTASSSVTTHLNRGERVYVRGYERGHRGPGLGLPSFSGFLVKPDC